MSNANAEASQEVAVGAESVPTGGRTRRRRAGLLEPIPRHHYGLIAFGSLALLLVIWAVASNLKLVNPLFLPTPAQVWDAFAQAAADGMLWDDTKASVLRIVTGFLISSAFALPIGVLMGSYQRTQAAIEPSVGFIRYMPAVAFIPITLIWFGTTETQKMVILFIGIFFQEVLLVMDNVKTVPKQFVEMGYTLGFSQATVLRRIIVPYALPGIVDTLRICMGWAWTYLVVAELVGAQTGLGFRIQTAERYLDTPLIFAGIIWIGVLGLIFDYGFKLIYAKSFPYMKRSR